MIPRNRDAPLLNTSYVLWFMPLDYQRIDLEI